MMRNKSELDLAYQFCQNLAQSHYENFPVGSLLLPKKLRRPISAIYAFARTADDFADEDNLDSENRLSLLNAYSHHLNEISKEQYRGDNPIFIALQDTIACFNLPVKLLEDLLIAFRQDVYKQRYATFNEVLEYCQLSANPVGRLLLYLHGHPSEQQLKQSDAICTALQLINFYQDIEQDYIEQNRIYLPQDELSKMQCQETDLTSLDTTIISPLLRGLYQRTFAIMMEGVELGISLHGRFGWEIRTITLSGLMTLQLLANQPSNAMLSRPRLSKQTLVTNVWRCATRNLYLKSINQMLASQQ